LTRFFGPRGLNKTAGDCPHFAECAEQNGTVPFSAAILSGILKLNLNQTGRGFRLLPRRGPARVVSTALQLIR
jgi:hypothetical protein